MSSSRDGKHQPAGQWITRAKRLAIYLRDELTCLYCGRELKTAAPTDITLDHLLSREFGGTNEATNLVTACRSCNCSRKSRPWVDYATGGARERIEQRRREPLNLALARALIAGSTGDSALESQR